MCLKVWCRQEGVHGRQNRGEKSDADNQGLLPPKCAEQLDQVYFIVRRSGLLHDHPKSLLCVLFTAEQANRILYVRTEKSSADDGF